jgi:chromosome transmission fidelity protein 1
VETFSCGHVIPATNLLALCVGKGPSGVSFNFTYKQRSTHGQMDELGRLLTNVVRQVPGGAICFVSSYGYLDELVERFRSTGALAQLERHKAVFTEPKAAKDVEGVLARYSEATCKSGALLFCVVGAKMSEGINFSDELARCIVMVGLPYPPKTDPELKERLKYLDSLDPSGGGRASREYYQSICMRAVNQSIGRSIRHANDYAAILLVDARYHQQAVINLLPQWIGQLAARTTAFGEVVSSINGFFLSCNKTRGERTSAEASAEATM